MYEWATLIQATDLTDVRARAHHPQSNGHVERLHCTLHEEMPLDAAASFYQAEEVIRHCRTYNNQRRPHADACRARWQP